MPLPDAKPDRRIYELLKTVDLENLTFSDFQSVAQTIYAEQGAEDELRRIVLVNLARLSVAGEWNGLTSAGASGFTSLISTVLGSPSNMDTFVISRGPIFGANRASNTNVTAQTYMIPNAYPFIAPKTGTLNEIQLYVNAVETGGATFKVGIYDSTSTNLPNNLLGYADFTMGSTGVETQTSLSDTISVTEGEVYYYVCTLDQSSTGGRIYAYGTDAYLPSLGIGTDASDTNKVVFRNGGSNYTLPSTFTITLGGSAGADPRPIVGVVIA